MYVTLLTVMIIVFVVVSGYTVAQKTHTNYTHTHIDVVVSCLDVYCERVTTNAIVRITKISYACTQTHIKKNTHTHRCFYIYYIYIPFIYIWSLFLLLLGWWMLV